MEKMIWTRPVAEVEQFMPNEYIAKCDDLVNTYYNFKCDAGGGKKGDVWRGGVVSGNTISGGELLTPDTNYIFYKAPGYYHACSNEIHHVPEADFDKTFSLGYYNASGYSDSTTGEFIPVYIWTGENNDNVHCMLQIGTEIETVKGNKS